MGKGNNIWDDPEWDALRRRVNKRETVSVSKIDADKHKQQKPATPPVVTPEQPKKVNLSINFFLPKVKLPKISKKRLKIGLASVGILGVSAATSLLIINRNRSTESNDVLSDSAQEPEFDTVLPDGKKEDTSSGKVGYDPQRKVASFTDTIGTANITVSQQPLPEAFKANPDEEVKKLAEGFSANNVINESNPKAYLGTDISGAQTVIFHKNNLLVFILSNKEIEKDQWAEYITKLL